MKPIYDEMMEQFYEDTQKKHKNIDELNESSTLPRGLSALTMDAGGLSNDPRKLIKIAGGSQKVHQEQTVIQVERKESRYYEELMEPPCLESQNHHADKVEEFKSGEPIKLSTKRDDSTEFALPEVFQEKQALEVTKSIASSDVPRYRNGSSSKKLVRGTPISTEARSPKIKRGIQKNHKDKTAAELNKLLMEAKSARDSSWYDVGTFLNHKVTGDGEIKARVRFAGFDSSHDEWVNVNRSIRQRSIPLQDSECHLVEVGDLVLCFRETGDSDLYFDARVKKIERNLHDTEGCKCIFQVCYEHDNYEEMVGLSKLCRRPLSEQYDLI